MKTKALNLVIVVLVILVIVLTVQVGGQSRRINILEDRIWRAELTANYGYDLSRLTRDEICKDKTFISAYPHYCNY